MIAMWSNHINLTSLWQLDFEDEPPDDESQPEEDEKSEEESHSDDDRFEDAFDQLTLHDECKPAMVAVSA